MIAAPVAGIELSSLSVCEHWVSSLWRCSVHPNTTRALLLCPTHNHTHKNTFSSLKAIEKAAFPLQPHQCFSREKGFQRAPPGQSKSLGSSGSSLCWLGRVGEQRVPPPGAWVSNVNGGFSGISRETLQGGGNFWFLVPCHGLLGVIPCKLLAYGHFILLLSEDDFLEFASISCTGKILNKHYLKTSSPKFTATSPVIRAVRCLFYSKLLFYNKQVFWCKKNSTKLILLDALHCA